MTMWVFTTEIDGMPAPSALELLAKARTAQGPTSVFYLGAGSDEAMAALGDHGAEVVYRLDPGDALPAAAAAAALADLVSEHGPDAILFSQGNTDRDVAGRLSARIDLPVIAGALDVSGTSVQSEILGGTTAVTTEITAGNPALIVTRPKAFAAEAVGGGAPQVVDVDLPDRGRSGAAKVTERHIEESEGPDLEAADIVVSGGRGLGAADKFEMLDELSKLLKGAVGATRAVVDAGWVPYSYQVGQTGKTVKPNVYVACGISGAMQHLVGMKDSSTIIAINKDPDAPIFGVSDLGIVGDVHQVLPRLIEELKTKS